MSPQSPNMSRPIPAFDKWETTVKKAPQTQTLDFPAANMQTSPGKVKKVRQPLGKGQAARSLDGARSVAHRGPKQSCAGGARHLGVCRDEEGQRGEVQPRRPHPHADRRQRDPDGGAAELGLRAEAPPLELGTHDAGPLSFTRLSRRMCNSANRSLKSRPVGLAAKRQPAAQQHEFAPQQPRRPDDVARRHAAAHLQPVDRVSSASTSRRCRNMKRRRRRPRLPAARRWWVVVVSRDTDSSRTEQQR